MIRLGCEKSGQNDPGKAGHHSPAEEAQVDNASDNAQVDDRVRRREYMRTYMRKRREHERAVIGEPTGERPPVKERRPPPPGACCPAEEAQVANASDKAQVDDRVRRREYMRTYMRKRRDERAALEAVAEDMIGDAAMMERLAQDYEYTAERMDGIGGVLGPAVEVYLGGGEMTSTELMALQAYLKRSITEPSWQGEGVESLRTRVEGLDTREKLKEWLGDAHELGIDPL